MAAGIEGLDDEHATATARARLGEWLRCCRIDFDRRFGRRRCQFQEFAHGAPPSTHLLHDAVEDQEVPVEMIAREFGKQVADIVMEVTDDKTLPKDERKRKQIETAPKKKSREAKLIKLADKTSNLRAIASSPAADWSVTSDWNT